MDSKCCKTFKVVFLLSALQANLMNNLPSSHIQAKTVHLRFQ